MRLVTGNGYIVPCIHFRMVTMWLLTYECKGKCPYYLVVVVLCGVEP